MDEAVDPNTPRAPTTPRGFHEQGFCHGPSMPGNDPKGDMIKSPCPHDGPHGPPPSEWFLRSQSAQGRARSKTPVRQPGLTKSRSTASRVSFKVEAEDENEKAKKEKRVTREKKPKKHASRSKSDEGEEDENKDRKDGKRRREKKAASEAILQLFGDKLKSQEKNVKTSSALAGKVVGLYFAGNWNGPCRTFTPKLAKTYQEVMDAGKPFEIVFVSSDRDEAAFNSFHDTQPWLALPYADRERKDKLMKLFDTESIPCLVIIDVAGEIIEKDGKRVDFLDIAFPWTPSYLAKKHEEANEAAEADRVEAKAVAEPEQLQGWEETAAKEAETAAKAVAKAVAEPKQLQGWEETVANEAEEDAEAAEGEGDEAEEAEGGDEGDPLDAGAETF